MNCCKQPTKEDSFQEPQKEEELLLEKIRPLLKADEISALREIFERNADQGIDLKDRYLDSIEGDLIKEEELKEEEEELSGKKRRRRKGKNIRVRGIKKREPPVKLKKEE